MPGTAPAITAVETTTATVAAAPWDSLDGPHGAVVERVNVSVLL